MPTKKTAGWRSVALTTCLNSVAIQTHRVDEIVLSDGGSSEDPSSFIPESLSQANSPTHTQTKIIHSPQGRGTQIKAGVEAMRSDWVIVLHADATLPPDAVEQLVNHLRHNSDVIGGCLGQRFDHGPPALLIVELLNELRGTLAKTSFGDQAQFFHRQTILQENLLSDQPLMEDVEISDRLGRYGYVSYLGNEVTVGASRWREQGFTHRFALIVRYFFRYRLLFWRSPQVRKRLSEQLVRDYYPAKNREEI